VDGKGGQNTFGTGDLRELALSSWGSVYFSLVGLETTRFDFVRQPADLHSEEKVPKAVRRFAASLAAASVALGGGTRGRASHSCTSAKRETLT